MAAKLKKEKPKKEMDAPLEDEDAEVNIPQMNPTKKRPPSLFQSADRSLRLKKLPTLDISEELNEDE